jgi:hypothetical protein
MAEEVKIKGPIGMLSEAIDFRLDLRPVKNRAWQ